MSTVLFCIVRGEKTKSEKECDDSDEVTDKIDLHSVVYKKWEPEYMPYWTFVNLTKSILLMMRSQ